MIRKPPSDWQPRESAALGTIRAAATGGVAVAKAGTFYLRALILWGFAALWGFASLAAGLSGSLPTFIGVGAMAFGAAWAGRRMLAKARTAR